MAATGTGPGARQATEKLRLDDGALLELRTITAFDRDRLEQMYESISDESRYRRFLNVHPRLTSSELTYLTEIDHLDHDALAAFDPTDGSMVAVVRYVRLDDPLEAEPAMLIADEWQGRGLVTALLARLAARAWAVGIRRFRAPVMEDNHAALRSLDRLGSPEHHRVGSEIEVDVMLDRPRRRLLRRCRRWRGGHRRPPLTPQTLIAGLTEHGMPESRASTGTVVVGICDSARCAELVELAANIATALGVGLALVRAHRGPSSAGYEHKLEQIAAPLREAGLAVETHVRRGTPSSVLVSVSAECGAGMLVLGATRRTGGASLIGATADIVARQAPCDVLLVADGAGEPRR